MMKKLKILGMELDNYTVWEAMGKVEGFLNTTIMNTVEAVSMEMLVKAQADSFLKECIEGLDLAIISDKEILKAAGEVSSLRMRETVENAFLKEFMRRVSRNHRIVYLLGDTREQLEELRVFLHENYN
ncbi:MAG: glycosyltransferase, partial [Lachnospiraceae bacterium]|nr:glycosyltransferase [Lachnospiraceae bacterium]